MGQQRSPSWRVPPIRRGRRHVFPRIGIGEMPISEETSADVIRILAPIWHDKAATAIKVPQRIRAVLEWAVAMDLRPDNPCNRIGPALGAQDKGGAVLRALPHGEVAGAIEAVRESDARPVVKLAFEFLALTATRSGEVGGRCGRISGGTRPCWPYRPENEGEIASTGRAVPSRVGDPREARTRSVEAAGSWRSSTGAVVTPTSRAHRSNPPPPRSGPRGRRGRGTGMTMPGPLSRSLVSWRSLIVSRTAHARRSASTSLLR